MAGTASLVEGVHRAVLARTPAATPAGAPVAAVHDAIARPVYGAIRGLGGAIGRAAGVAAGLSRPATAAPLADSGRGAAALGALAGACGDRLERERSPLAVRMALCRGDGRAVALEPSALTADVPDATPRLAVFVHGLGETARTWAPPEGRPGYGERLQADLGITPLWLRFNSGLPVAENGRRLSALLEETAAAWPVALEEIALIGHSMGGLVARSAALAGRRSGAAWLPALRHVACLASPHHGAPGEKAAHLAARALGVAPESRPFATIVELRSAGIRDLRHGLTDDPAFVETADYWALSATVTRDPRHPLGRVAGDGLVRPASATGPGVPFPAGGVVHAGGLHHFAVLDSPAVYAALRARLGVTRPAPAARRRAGSGGSRGSRRAGRARS